MQNHISWRYILYQNINSQVWITKYFSVRPNNHYFLTKYSFNPKKISKLFEWIWITLTNLNLTQLVAIKSIAPFAYLGPYFFSQIETKWMVIPYTINYINLGTKYRGHQLNIANSTHNRLVWHWGYFFLILLVNAFFFEGQINKLYCPTVRVLPLWQFRILKVPLQIGS